MALMRCPECGKEVSTLADTCPGCGYPLHTLQNKSVEAVHPNRRKCLSGATAAVAVLGAIVLLLVCIFAISRFSTPNDPSGNDLPSHLSAYSDARDYIREHYYSDAEFSISSTEFTDYDTYIAVNGSFSHDGVKYQFIVKVDARGDVVSCDLYDW